MTLDPFRYDLWIEDALRGVVRRTLAEVAKNGNCGEHHFYITFHTQAPGVTIPDHLLAQYPEEITIVLQHEFWDLAIHPDYFEVALSFNNTRSRLQVPFAAISAFADPSVKFGLQLKMDSVSDLSDGVFDDSEGLPDIRPAEANSDSAAKPADAPGETPAEAEAPKTGEVIALDAFRKK